MVFARNAADKPIAADYAVNKAIINRAAEVVARNATDPSIAADFAADCAIFYRASVVVADNAADIPIAANIGINQRDIFNRAVVITEQAAITAAVRYLEVADTVALTVERAFERKSSVADGCPVRYAAKVEVVRELERQTCAIVPLVDVSRKTLQIGYVVNKVNARFQVETHCADFRSVLNYYLRIAQRKGVA